MLIVTAKIIANLGQEENLKQKLIALIDACKKQEGLILYSVQQSTTDPRHFLFYERFINHEAFKKHQNSPELQAWRKEAPKLVESSEAELFDFVAEVYNN